MTTFTLGARPARFSISMMKAASPTLWWTGHAFLVLCALCALLALVDPRQFNGISTWVKPAKFALSLAVHVLTVAAGLLLLPERPRKAFITRASVAAIVAMALLEQAYIVFRAARAEASHFNASNELAQILYAAMGIGAVSIMLGTAVIGWQILRHGGPSLLARATGASFLVASALTIWVGLTLGGMGSHWIGGDQTDATGLPLIGWSTTGGDLRVAHFTGLHLMQLIPLTVALRSNAFTWSALLAGIAATIAAYLQALAGNPLVNL